MIVAFAGGMGVAALRDAQSADAVGPGTTAAAAKRPPIAQAADPGRAAARVTIAWGGDTVLGSDYGLPADHGMVLLEHVAPLLRSADVGWVNLEEALATGGSSKCVGATLGQLLRVRRAALVRVDAATGRDPDRQPREQPCRRLRRVGSGLDARGAPRRPRRLGPEAGRDRVLTVRGLRIAFLGFAPYPWASRLDDIPSAVALVRHAAARADLVLVAIHAGAEGPDAAHVPVGTEYYLGENRGNSRAFAHAVIDAGADLVVGSGPHVVRGAQWYHGRLILYSLGNLAGWRTFGLGGALSQSAIASVTLSGAGAVVGGHWSPLVLLSPGVPVADPDRSSLERVNDLSRTDFGASGARFGADGALVVPRAARRGTHD